MVYMACVCVCAQILDFAGAPGAALLAFVRALDWSQCEWLVHGVERGFDAVEIGGPTAQAKNTLLFALAASAAPEQPLDER